MEQVRAKLLALGYTELVTLVDRCLSRLPEPVLANLEILPALYLGRLHIALTEIQAQLQPFLGQTCAEFLTIRASAGHVNHFAPWPILEADVELWHLCNPLLVAAGLVALHPGGGGPKDAEIFGRWNVGIKHPELRAVTHGALMTQSYDEAIANAAKLVEDQLRMKLLALGCTEASSKTAGDLVSLAFSKTGLLVPPWAAASQAEEGAGQTLRGFFLHIRNAYAHQRVGNTGEGAFELLAHAEYLLKLIELSVPKP